MYFYTMIMSYSIKDFLEQAIDFIPLTMVMHPLLLYWRISACALISKWSFIKKISSAFKFYRASILSC